MKKAFRTRTPGNYPKENILHKEHGESLISRNFLLVNVSLAAVQNVSGRAAIILKFSIPKCYNT